MRELDINNLELELEELELDSGIMIIDEFNNTIFITRSGNIFCIMFNDKYLYAQHSKDVINIINNNAKGIVKVWLY